MTKINWKIRFTKDNILFIIRVLIAVLTPALAIAGLDVKDLTSWSAVLDILVQIVTNPYLLGLTIIGFLNILPDPTTKGIGDSEQALTYETPKEGYVTKHGKS